LPPALLAGNTLVVKPAPTTPIASLKFAELIAGLLPNGVVNFITDANDLGDALTHHPDVRKISFTGSTATGRKVMASAAETLCAFQNSGQVCLAIKRLYMHESIYDEMCNELAQLADAAIVDDGSKQGTQLGPLQNRMQYNKVKAFLEDAKKHGNIVAGGEVMDRPGYFIRPTIVRDITEGSRLVDEEQFGPILPVLKYASTDEVIKRANATTYGLGASVWSSNIDRAQDVAAQLEAGTVWINTHLDMAPHIPFGGAKNSGLGVEFGEFISEFPPRSRL
jgi:acyl-CoA reductase-like NAD-dependent aldehyde dehydrogenase